MGIKAKQSLEGKLNNAKEYVYPELEDLEVTPSMETQNFKSSKYGYDDVKVNAINSQQLTVSPTKASQTHTGLYDTVNVNGSSDLEAQNIVRGKTIFGVSGTFDGVDTSDADAISGDIKMTKTAYVNGVKLTGTLEEDYAKFVQDDGDGNDVVCYIYKPDLEEGDLEDIEHIFDSNSSLVETLLEIAESGADDIEDVITAIDVSTMQDIISLTDIVYNLYLYRDTLIKIIIEATSETTLDIYNMTAAYEPYDVTVALEEDELLGDITIVVGDVTQLVAPDGTLNISANGTYDVTQYASAEVSITNANNAKMLTDASAGFIFALIEEVPDLEVGTRTTLQQMFQNCSSLKKAPNMTTTNVMTFNKCFQNCSSLVDVPIYDMSSTTNTRQMFEGCSSLKTAPNFDTSNVIDISYMFQNCSSLENVPVYDWSNVSNLGSIFNGCYTLTDDSLNNILASCIGATSYSGTKTLSTLGLYFVTTAQKAIVQGLSNYTAFIEAGWTISY